MIELVRQKDSQNTETLQNVVVWSLCNDITIVDDSGKTLLMHAALADNWLFVEALALHGADLFSADNKQWTAFHYAAEQNHYRSLQVLIRFGAKERDLNLLNEDGESPMDVALKQGSGESVLLLNSESYMGDTMLKMLSSLKIEGDITTDDYQTITAFDNMDSAESEGSKIILSASGPSVPISQHSTSLTASDPTIKTMWVRGSENLKDEPKRGPRSLFRRKEKSKTKASKRARLLKRAQAAKTHQEESDVTPTDSPPKSVGLNKSIDLTVPKERTRSQSYGERYFMNNTDLELAASESRSKIQGDAPISIHSEGDECYLSDTGTESDSSYDEVGFDESEDREEVYPSPKKKPSYPNVVSIPGFEFPTST